jgi:serine/threonine protein kinase
MSEKIYHGAEEEYTLTSDWHTGSEGSWAFAEKEGKEYFIKTLKAPFRPTDTSAYDEEYIANKTAECDAFDNYKSSVFSKLKSVSRGEGNLLVPISYGWNSDGHFEIISRKGDDIGSLDMMMLDDKNFLIAIRVLCFNISKIHKAGVVHGDLKPYISDKDPGNILFSLGENGLPILRIIDFDDSYLSGNPLSQEETGGTPKYWSPELLLYKNGMLDDASEMTTKSDVFTLGLIIHQYASNGELPDKCGYSSYFDIM